MNMRAVLGVIMKAFYHFASSFEARRMMDFLQNIMYGVEGGIMNRIASEFRVNWKKWLTIAVFLTLLFWAMNEDAKSSWSWPELVIVGVIGFALGVPLLVYVIQPLSNKLAQWSFSI